MMYTREDYILFLLAIILIFGGLWLLGTVIEILVNRKLKRREEKARTQARRAELKRRHNAYLTEMNEVLESVNGRRSA